MIKIKIKCYFMNFNKIYVFYTRFYTKCNYLKTGFLIKILFILKN